MNKKGEPILCPLRASGQPGLGCVGESQKVPVSMIPSGFEQKFLRSGILIQAFFMDYGQPIHKIYQSFQPVKTRLRNPL